MFRYAVVNLRKKLCVTDRGRGTDEGNEVWLYEPNGTPAQEWLTITI